MKMHYLLSLKTLAALILTLCLCACGETNDVAGIGGSGSKVVGTIDAFGSIFVNGIEFDVDEADVFFGDEPTSIDDLRLGMVVTVTGVINADGKTGVATVINYSDAVKGAIESINTSTDGNQKTLRILGSEVKVSKTKTVMDGVTFDALNQNDVVKISGFVVEKNIIDATRIEKIDDSSGMTEVEIKGVITALGQFEFLINEVRVDFNTAVFQGITREQLVNGKIVEVGGRFDGQVLYAKNIKLASALFEQNVFDTHLKGIISNFVDKFHFSVSGQVVDATRARFEIHQTVLMNGVIVSLEGTIVNGVLYATEVEIPD